MWIYITNAYNQSSMEIDFTEDIWDNIKNIPVYVDDFSRGFITEVIDDPQLRKSISNLEIFDKFETKSGIKGVRQA